MRRSLSFWLPTIALSLMGAVAACGDAGSGNLAEGARRGAGDGTRTFDGDEVPPGGGSGDGSLDGGAGATTVDGSVAAAPTSSQSCTSCHGEANRAAVAGADPNVAAAPPRGAKGQTATSDRAVGAHQAHVNAADILAKPIACTECHVVPTSTGHSNGRVDIAFGTLARTGGAAPAWTGATCTNTYCHGAFPGGTTAAAPTWTGGAMTCESCHGAPPNTGDHRRERHNVACSECHGTGYTSTTVNVALHLNGAKNAGGAGSKITTWDPTNRSCTPTCHGQETW